MCKQLEGTWSHVEGKDRQMTTPVINHVQDLPLLITAAAPTPAAPRQGLPLVSVDIDGHQYDEEVQKGYVYTGEAEQANRMVEAVQDLIDDRSAFEVNRFYFTPDGCLVLECHSEEYFTASRYNVTITVRL